MLSFVPSPRRQKLLNLRKYFSHKVTFMNVKLHIFLKQFKKRSLSIPLIFTFTGFYVMSAQTNKQTDSVEAFGFRSPPLSQPIHIIKVWNEGACKTNSTKLRLYYVFISKSFSYIVYKCTV